MVHSAQPPPTEEPGPLPTDGTPEMGGLYDLMGYCPVCSSAEGTSHPVPLETVSLIHRFMPNPATVAGAVMTGYRCRSCGCLVMAGGSFFLPLVPPDQEATMRARQVGLELPVGATLRRS